MALGHGAAQLAGRWLDAWAFLPALLVFWSALAVLIAWGGGAGAPRRWLAPARGGGPVSVLALAIGLAPLPIFWEHRELLAGLVLPWLAFALVNPWLEEGYWRGLLLDAAARWPAGLAVLYTAAVFAASHPVIWGVHSEANRNPVGVAVIFGMGVVWALAYRRSGSLRFAIAGHAVTDLLNLAVPTLMNLYVPESRP